MDTSQPCPTPTSSTPSLTLIIQTTLSRLWIVHETCQRWTDNPLILIIYVPHGVTPPSQSQEYNHYLALCSSQTILEYVAPEGETADKYPVNRLRNAGIARVQTSHFMTLDADFVPSQSLATIANAHLTLDDKDTALVVPAFERKESCETVEQCQQFMRDDPSYLPENFTGLQNCVKEKHCRVFQSKSNWEGHYDTFSAQWLSSKDETLKDIPCFHTARYEPYVILRHCPHHSPLYDERFYGYGKNKISYVSQLRYLNYEFAVLPRGFVVHHPHPPSEAKVEWLKDGSEIHGRMDRLYIKFMKELIHRYGKPRVQICDRDE